MDSEFINGLINYRVFKPKSETYPDYRTINFIERNVAGINHEEVELYSQTLGKLFKWLLTAIKTRKEDIIRRKAAILRARERRANIIEAIRLREEKQAVDIEEAENKFKEDRKEEIEAFFKYEQME